MCEETVREKANLGKGVCVCVCVCVCESVCFTLKNSKKEEQRAEKETDGQKEHLKMKKKETFVYE